MHSFLVPTFTSTTTLAMECQRENAGVASALLGAMGFAFGGIVSPLVGLGNILTSTGLVFVLCACGSLLSMLIALGQASAGTSLFSGRQACQTLKPMLVPFL